jgi:hypothetical protein
MMEVSGNGPSPTFAARMARRLLNLMDKLIMARIAGGSARQFALGKRSRENG